MGRYIRKILFMSLVLFTLPRCEEQLSLRSMSLGDLPVELQCLIQNPALNVHIITPESAAMRIYLDNGSQFLDKLVYSGCGDPVPGLSSLYLNTFTGAATLSLYYSQTVMGPVRVKIETCSGDVRLDFTDLDFNVNYAPDFVCTNVRPGSVNFDEHGVDIDPI